MAIPWWAWVIAAGLLAVAELHAPGGYFVWLALGAAATSAVHAAFGASLEAQLITFVVASAVSCSGGYLIYRRIDHGRQNGRLLNQRHLEMVGTRGIVCETFCNGLGKIRVGDTVWLASGGDFVEGTPIVITGVRGTRLLVQAARQQ
jgi:inner membrane protein